MVYDLVFMDPPYSKNILPPILEKTAKITSDSGIIICESEKESILPNQVDKFVLDKGYLYGSRKITIYKNTNF